MCFAGLPLLRKLNLRGNDLVQLPSDTFAGLPSLRVLAIVGKGTPGEHPLALLDGLAHLQTLSMSGEDTSLPEDHGRLPQLTY